ncbi:histidine kinase, partial [Streptomyces sp. ME02-6985-2c]|nr:histidine kinase [Streptomyces sp. ME02-6985-2c]
VRPVRSSRPAPAGPAAAGAGSPRGHSGASAHDASDGRGGLAPLPRRVPQTSLAAELRDEDPGGRRDGSDHAAADAYADFTAERAASSLAGFQRGTLRAHTDDDADEAADPRAAHEADEAAEGVGGADDRATDGHALSSAAHSTPTADRRPPTKDTR